MMKLFCEKCTGYLGPVNRECPQCGWDRGDQVFYTERGLPVWPQPVRLQGHPVGRPVFSNGLILVAWQNGKTAGGLSAFEKNGKLRWQITGDGVMREEPQLHGDYAIFTFGGLLDGGSLTCCRLDTQNPQGEIVWKQAKPEVFSSRINGGAIKQENRLYVPCADGTIACLDAIQNQMVPGWPVRVLSSLHWLMFHERNLLAIDREKGQILLVDPFRGAAAGPTISFNSRLVCKPLSWNGKLFVFTEDGRIFKTDPRLGTAMEFTQQKTQLLAQPVVSNGLMIAGSLDHHIYGWHESGEQKWKSDWHSEHAFASSPAICGEFLVVGANDGHAYAFNGETGERLWSFNSGFEKMPMRDVLYQDGICYLAGYNIGHTDGYLFALPWHLGEYEIFAEKAAQKNTDELAGDLFAVGSYYAKRMDKRNSLAQRAVEHWCNDGQAQRAAAFWESQRRFDLAVKYWQEAAEWHRPVAPLRAAEFYYQASQMHWRLGNPAAEEDCAREAAWLANWPLLRIVPFNNPVQVVGKPGSLVVRLENIGLARAENLHLDVSGSLLEPINFNMVQPLDCGQYYNLSFLITTTHTDDNVKIDVTCSVMGRELPIKTSLEVRVLSTKVGHIKLGDMVMGEIKVISEEGADLDIEIGDTVSSKMEFVMVNQKTN